MCTIPSGALLVYLQSSETRRTAGRQRSFAGTLVEIMKYAELIGV